MDNVIRYLNGLIGEVKFFDYLLSRAEFQTGREALVYALGTCIRLRINNP